MSEEFLFVPGGLGLFLFGMSVMTDGLRGIAGDLLHRTLARFTRSPATGALSGAAVTALLQSSSATTVAAVGFVSAGLLSFPQSLGILFGANVGTTVTGWLVAILGLKFSIGNIAYPMVLGGALLRLFGRGKLTSGGTALAGFGLIFIGISVLQDGMAAYQGMVTPESFPDDTLLGRLLLLGIGVLITLVTQSSSAGVATALTAVFTGTITFPQAAAMVIGMDVGTTITAALATVGRSVETRRTGYSHVIYNLMTGLGAFILLTPYAWLAERLVPGALTQHAELALVGFHTVFNLLGVLLVLPFAGRFAALMTRLVPDRTGETPGQLEASLLKEPAVALAAASHVSTQLVLDTLYLVQHLIESPRDTDQNKVDKISTRADQLQGFVDQIHLLPEQEADWRRLNALIHLLDHLQRLLDRCEEEPERVRTLVQVSELRLETEAMDETLARLRNLLTDEHWEAATTDSAGFARTMDAKAESLRTSITADMASGVVDIPQGTSRLEAVRWLRRGSAHIARILAHLAAVNS